MGRSVEYQVLESLLSSPSPSLLSFSAPARSHPPPPQASRPTLSSASVTPHLCSKPLKLAAPNGTGCKCNHTCVKHRMKKSQCQMSNVPVFCFRLITCSSDNLFDILG